jgi:condensin complex subunit 2
MARSRGGPATPVRTTKIPLNDDSAEKAKRARERNLLQSIQKQKMMAAASPGVRRQSGGDAMTPRRVTMGGAEDVITPMRRAPLLANWEEMMKLATDNVCARGEGKR